MKDTNRGDGIYVKCYTGIHLMFGSGVDHINRLENEYTYNDLIVCVVEE